MDEERQFEQFGGYTFVVPSESVSIPELICCPGAHDDVTFAAPASVNDYWDDWDAPEPKKVLFNLIFHIIFLFLAKSGSISRGSRPF